MGRTWPTPHIRIDDPGAQKWYDRQQGLVEKKNNSFRPEFYGTDGEVELMRDMESPCSACKDLEKTHGSGFQYCTGARPGLEDCDRCAQDPKRLITTCSTGFGAPLEVWVQYLRTYPSERRLRPSFKTPGGSWQSVIELRQKLIEPCTNCAPLWKADERKSRGNRTLDMNCREWLPGVLGRECERCIKARRKNPSLPPCSKGEQAEPALEAQFRWEVVLSQGGFEGFPNMSSWQKHFSTSWLFIVPKREASAESPPETGSHGQEKPTQAIDKPFSPIDTSSSTAGPWATSPGNAGTVVYGQAYDQPMPPRSSIVPSSTSSTATIDPRQLQPFAAAPNTYGASGGSASVTGYDNRSRPASESTGARGGGSTIFSKHRGSQHVSASRYGQSGSLPGSAPSRSDLEIMRKQVADYEPPALVPEGPAKAQAAPLPPAPGKMGKRGLDTYDALIVVEDGSARARATPRPPGSGGVRRDVAQYNPPPRAPEGPARGHNNPLPPVQIGSPAGNYVIPEEEEDEWTKAMAQSTYQANEHDEVKRAQERERQRQRAAEQQFHAERREIERKKHESRKAQKKAQEDLDRLLAKEGKKKNDRNKRDDHKKGGGGGKGGGIVGINWSR